jgi:hypothetical protein
MKRRATDKDIRSYFKQLVRGSVSCDDDTTMVPTWVAAEVDALLDKAKKQHGGQQKSGRAKVWERTALSIGRSWWRELKAQKVAEPQRKAAQRVKERFLPHLSEETILRLLRNKRR